ncbi:unnamed protein product [Triticum turgidum subsp. durum]|uniref:Uncharacterized protein n=1 Tax=Triticum turgidum subsp. durum TaxID=4567 RepID=A0A9R1NM79_TRITD|nr:unnamed protein product [Triticum turgidum subsp. durum]
MSSRSSPLALNIASSTVTLAKGGGRSRRVSLAKDTRPSYRPAGILMSTTPLLRKKLASRPAKATMSAHETTPRHSFSSFAFAASITSKPRRLGKFGMPSFSGSGLAVVASRRTEASQP